MMESTGMRSRANKLVWWPVVVCLGGADTPHGVARSGGQVLLVREEPVPLVKRSSTSPYRGSANLNKEDGYGYELYLFGRDGIACLWAGGRSYSNRVCCRDASTNAAIAAKRRNLTCVGWFYQERRL